MAKDERDPPGDIPPVHVLEAMHEQEKKETEELLSGFDRPGRTPQRRAAPRDFVDYYASKANKDESARVPAAAAPSSRRVEAPVEERATLVLPRTRSLRAVVVWVAAVVGMVLFGAIVAILATPDPPQARTVPTMVPSSATTITSGSPAPIETAQPDEGPETTTPTVIVAAPPSAAKPVRPAPATPAVTSASTGAAATIKTAPRDDFIRDL